MIVVLFIPMIAPKIITISEKMLIGMKSLMLRYEYENIIALWKQFMPRTREITSPINHEYIALQDYANFNDFETPFDIWAAVEVSGSEMIPEQMQPYTIPGGIYAVFLHKGMDAGATYQRIITEWLPTSGYIIDDRPHFQVMGENYKNGSPDSEEDFYVPIRKL
ncbi:GyrI-like domain-containing protein [Winogradskyella sp.]|uniref:GyrI-like domain-containing protein n=1 Tax=Winogradskyella sp. TaxID=1883156 RepID=UPI0026209874|nr:GyrI-like domain-containing protein [Winogradskyella sp.]